jgi:hypothetical protein
MSVAKLLPAGGANDFNVSITGLNTTVTFTKEYSAGGYSIVSSLNDNTIDIYAFNADGSQAGYTATKSFTATKGFSKMVLIGGSVGDLLSFSFKQTFIASASDTEVTAGPFITTASTTSLPNAGSSTTITGGNFATDVTGTFTSASTATVYTSTIVRSSATSISVTRPADLPVLYNPYTLTISNPGVSDPAATTANKILVNAGLGTPVWVTTTPLSLFTKSVAYSTTLVATDTDGGSAVTYSIVGGSLPTGLSLAGSTGVISGTPTVETNASFTIRATDSGGNFLDKSFSLPNVLPTITNTSLLFGGSLPTMATSNDGGGSVTFAVTGGSLPAGITLNSNGTFSGTPSGNGSGSVTITATDSGGNTNTAVLPTSFRSLAAGSTFNYASPPAFYLATDIITGFPVGSATYSFFGGATTVRISCSGGGGARSNQSNGGTGGNGANGGLSVGTFSVTNLSTPITVFTGGGGQTAPANQGAGGGGYSGVRRSDNTWLIVAGGGGGGGGPEGGTGGAGGSGGGANQNGNAGAAASSGAQPGGGGTQSAGGGGGSGSYGSGNAGGSFQGGAGNGGGGAAGGTNGGGQGGGGYGGGGGGGGGFYGGGGGGAASPSSAGGGGGSGYLNLSYGSVVTATTGGGGAGATANATAGSAGSVTITIVS